MFKLSSYATLSVSNKQKNQTFIQPSNQPSKITPFRLLSAGILTVIGTTLVGCASQPTNYEQPPVYVRGVPSYYIVQPGDTLSRIATRYGLDFRRVGALNGLDANYTIYPGQRLILTTARAPANTNNRNTYPVTPAPTRVNVPPRPVVVTPNRPIPMSPMSSAPIVVNNSQQWLRPVSGNIIRPFNQSAGSLGVWYGAPQGTPVVASQAGTVLYVGSDLPEYGRLVMIQHNDDYVSAYAHLDNFNVQERQTVQAGQQIGSVGYDATMNQPALEFQIRYRGAPTNPANFVR